MTQMSGIGLGGLSATSVGAAGSVSPEQREALEKAARGFEAIFVRQLMKTMRGASLGEGIDSSSSVEQFQEMQDANMAEGMSRHGGLGIADLILQQLDKR